MPKNTDASLNGSDDEVEVLLSEDQKVVLDYVLYENDCNILTEGSLFEKYGRERLINLLDSLNSYPDIYGGSLSSYCAMNGKLKILIALKTCGHDLEFPNKAGYYPVHLAAKEGRLDVLKYFATSGKKAGNCNDKYDFQILLPRHTETKINHEYSKEIPLYLAAENMRFECVDYLIEQHAARAGEKSTNFEFGPSLPPISTIAKILAKTFQDRCNGINIDSKLVQPLKDITKQAAALAPKIKTLDELRQLNKSLWCVQNVLLASNDQKDEAIAELNNAIKDCLTIKGSKWKQFIGALCMFAGVAIMAAGVMLAPPVAAVLAGGLLAVGGATLFAKGRNRSMKSSLEAFAKNESHTLNPK